MIHPAQFVRAFLLIKSFAVSILKKAQTLPQGLTKLASVEGITEYPVANSLRVLLFSDSANPTLRVNFRYLVGSRQEGYAETGIVHLLEHMVFKESTKHLNIRQEFNQFGDRWNDATFYEQTNFFEIILAAGKTLKWAVELEADRLGNSLDKEIWPLSFMGSH